MRCWGELKSLRVQSVGEVWLVMHAIFTKSWLHPCLRNEQERFWGRLTTVVKQKQVLGHFIACASWNNLVSYLGEKKKRLRVLQILFTLVSCHMSFQYLIICAVLISQTRVLSTLLLYLEYTWLTPQAGKMSLSCPFGSTVPALCCKKRVCFNNIINRLLTKLVCSRRLGTSLVLFYVFMDLKRKTWPISSHTTLTHA